MADKSHLVAWAESHGFKHTPNATLNVAGHEIFPNYSDYYLSQNGKQFTQMLNKGTKFIPSKVTQLPKVDVDFLMHYYKQYLNFGVYTEYVMRMMMRKFVETAAKFSPPNIGKANIEQKYYYRPIYKIEDLAKGLIRTEKGRVLHATREDFAALRAGMKFKIVNTKHGTKKGTAFAYTKGINEAKRLARIENRGLTKYSWGSLLNTFVGQNMKTKSKHTSFGIFRQKPRGDKQQMDRRVLIQTDMPPIFTRLQRKSPNIKKYKWGYVDWTEDKQGESNNVTLTFQNNLAEVEQYCEIAIRQGINAAVRETNKLLRFIETNAAKRIEKMFDFNIYKVKELAAVSIQKERKG